jgi:hypothetical protein
VTDDDWYLGKYDIWVKGRPYDDDLCFTEDELDDWPPLVALRAENARLHQLVDHLKQARDADWYAMKENSE